MQTALLAETHALEGPNASTEPASVKIAAAWALMLAVLHVGICALEGPHASTEPASVKITAAWALMLAVPPAGTHALTEKSA